MSQNSLNPEVRVNVSWNELSKLEKEIEAAADRLEIKNSQHLTITVGGSKRGVNVRLAAGGTQIRIPSNEKVTKQNLTEDKINVHTTQEEKPEKEKLKTAEIGTQTEPFQEKEEFVLVSSYSFAPYSLKNGFIDIWVDGGWSCMAFNRTNKVDDVVSESMVELPGWFQSLLLT